MYEPIRTFVFHWCSSVSDWKKCNQGTPSFGNRSTKDTSTTPRGYIRRHLTDSIRSKDKHKTSKHFYLNPEAVFSQGRITCWTFFLGVCLQNNTLVVKRDIMFFPALKIGRRRFKLRKMTARKRFSSYMYAKNAVNVSRNEEDATKCCNARTRSARRRRVIGRVVAEKLENQTGPIEMENRNKLQMTELLCRFAHWTAIRASDKYSSRILWQVVCHYADCDWLRHLPGQVTRTPSREGV